jgi:cobalt-zinc-cadmium efflux system protein
MAHIHSAEPPRYHRAFAIGIALNVSYIITEIIFGLKSDSLALLADAGHNSSDVLSLLLSWGAVSLAQAKPSERRTYGFRRTTILASLFNAVLLLIAIGAVAWEAISRFSNSQPVAADTVIWVASVGVVINAATALLFIRGSRGDLNIKGAYLHMAADAGVSLGVVFAGIVMSMSSSGLPWIDPMISLVIVGVIAVGTWGLFRDSINLALDAVPKEIDLNVVREYLCGLPEVSSVHDLHIWAMSTTETALTAHLIVPNANIVDSLLAQIGRELHDKFGIEHATLQVERDDVSSTCKLKSNESV